MNKRAGIAVGFLLAMLIDGQGRTQTFPDRERQTPFITNCWIEAQTFSSLRTGAVDYCKKHMRYAPGTLDCYTFETQVCEMFQPATRDWTQDRRPLSPRVFECPDEPEPPLCPSTPALRW
jgi:hypothetical protein